MAFKIIGFLGNILQEINLVSQCALFKRRKIFILSYFKVLFKYYILRKIIKINSEKIMGYRINFSDYFSFHIMFKEIFIRDSYYFNLSEKNPTILDFGSNIGMAMIYFKIIWPNSKIICVEPDKKAYNYILKNINDNNISNVEVYNCLVSDLNGESNFFYSKEHASLKMSTLENRGGQDVTVVETKAFSYFTEKYTPKIIKMDIEGSEFKIFREGVNYKLGENTEYFAMELHHNISKDNNLSELVSVFENMNYKYTVEATTTNKYRNADEQNILLRFFKI